MAVATIGLVITAALQWNTLKRQAKAMEDQLATVRSEVSATKDIADSTKKTLLFAHRPTMVLRHIVVKGIDEGIIGDRLYDGYAWLTNVGPSRVNLLGFHAQWFVAKRLPLENPLLNVETTAITPVPFGPASVMKQALPDYLIATLDEHRNLWGDDTDEESLSRANKNTAKWLYLIGSFKYTDEIGMRRRYFCYRFSIRQNRFVEEPHPNYNYED